MVRQKHDLSYTVFVVSLILAMIGPTISSTVRVSREALTNSYSGHLYVSSPMFTRPHGSSYYYYEKIKLTVDQSGDYTLTSSNSAFNAYGCVYDTFFKPSSPSNNLMQCDEGEGGGREFQITKRLESGKTYILVVTSFSSYATGRFQITAEGTGTVYMTQYTTQTTSQYGYIRSSNPKFARSGSYSSNYYYNTIEIIVYTTGTYSLTSSKTYSTDTYACLYRYSFYPSSPSSNRIACDDDSGTSRQFLMTQNLDASTKYILVITTSLSYAIGSYSIEVTGPSAVSMSITTPNASSVNVGPIVGGVVGGAILLFFIVIIIIVVCKRGNRAATPQTTMMAPYNQNVPNVLYPTVYQAPTPYVMPPPPYNTIMTSNKQ